LTHEERVTALLERMADTLEEIKGLLGQKPVQGKVKAPVAKRGNNRAGEPPSKKEPQRDLEEFNPSLDDLKEFYDSEFGGGETEDSPKPLLRWPKRK
jgi:hypothetical protein